MADTPEPHPFSQAALVSQEVSRCSHGAVPVPLERAVSEAVGGEVILSQPKKG